MDRDAKLCLRCKITKPISEFYTKKGTKDGFRCYCIECEKMYYWEHMKERKVYSDGRKDKKKEYDKEYGKNHQEGRKASQEKYKREHGPKKKEYDRNYQKEHKKEIREQQLHRRKVDILFRLKSDLRNLIGASFRRAGFKKDSRTAQILGCTWEKAKLYLELLFWPGMTWDNRGRDGWHIDHIIPVSSGITEEEIVELNHYTNLQPLWGDDNVAKKARFDWSPQESRHPLPDRLKPQ